MNNDNNNNNNDNKDDRDANGSNNIKNFDLNKKPVRFITHLKNIITTRQTVF